MPIRAPKYSGRILITLGFIVVIFAFLQFTGSGTPVDRLSQTYSIPPSFNGIRLLYGMTLAVLLPMSLFSAGLILENARFLLTNNGTYDEPAKVSVVNDLLILSVIWLGITPDAIVLLAWGEQSAPTSSALAATDRALDMISGVLFLVAVVRRIRSRPIVLFMLQREPIPVDMQPTWAMLWPKLRIGLVVVLLSFGVAFAK